MCIIGDGRGEPAPTGVGMNLPKGIIVPRSQHWYLHTLLAGALYRLLVAGIHVAHHARPGIVRQYPREPLGCLRRTIRYNHLARVDRIAYAHPTSMMNRDPRRASVGRRRGFCTPD
jgi:hypothetical protein